MYRNTNLTAKRDDDDINLTNVKSINIILNIFHSYAILANQKNQYS